MKDDYSIERHSSGRFIVWRLAEGKKLRQGSHETEEAAHEAMERSIKILEG